MALVSAADMYYRIVVTRFYVVNIIQISVEADEQWHVIIVEYFV